MRYRSAITGRFVTRLQAIQSPDTTVSEGVLEAQPIEEVTVEDSIPLDLMEMDLPEAIGTAMGAVSACWTNLDGAGVFMSDFASDIMDQLLERVKYEIQMEVKDRGNHLPA